MKYKRIIIALLLSLNMIVSCGDVSKDSDMNNSKSIEEVTVLNMFSEDLNPNYEGFESPVAQVITQKTGVKLEIEYPIGNVYEKTGVMLASGDYPDFIMVKDTAKFVDAGAYIDLTSLIEQHAPNIQKLYKDVRNRLQYSDLDDSIYVLPMAGIEAKKLEPTMGFQLQHAVVKELGYPKIKTLEDFENAIATYMEKHPVIDGQKTIGLSLISDDWRWLISIGNGAAFATGKPDDGQWYINPDTYEATYRFLMEDEKEYFRWLNHMFDRGLLDPDSFVQKFEAYEAKIASGRVLGLIDAFWEYRTAEQILISEGKYINTYGQYPVQFDHTTQAAEFRYNGYVAGYGIGISVNCKDPVKAIKFIDFMASDEGQILRNWGIEGQNYYIDENGKRIVPEEERLERLIRHDYTKITGVGVYIYPFPGYGIGVMDQTGNTYSVDNSDWIIQGYNDIEKEVLEAYGVKTWKELYPDETKIRPSKWGAAWNIHIPDDSGIRPILTQCDEIIKTGVIKAIIAQPDEFDGVWNGMIKQLEDAGVYEMNGAFTKLVKQRVKDWKE